MSILNYRKGIGSLTRHVEITKSSRCFFNIRYAEVRVILRFLKAMSGNGKVLHCAALFPILQFCIFIHLWAIYVFPRSVHLFCCSQIGRLILGIYVHKNRSQIQVYEFRNGEQGRTVSFLWIFFLHIRHRILQGLNAPAYPASIKTVKRAHAVPRPHQCGKVFLPYCSTPPTKLIRNHEETVQGT